MAKLAKFCRALLVAFSLVGFSVSAQSPEISPSPAPELGADSSSPLSPAPNVRAPANPPSTLSPPAPSPVDLAPGSSPTPAPSKSPAPTPELSDTGALGQDETARGGDEDQGSFGGISRGKKAGIVIGVIVAAGLVGLIGLVYKKRRDNMRRTQYGYAARTEIL